MSRWRYTLILLGVLVVAGAWWGADRLLAAPAPDLGPAIVVMPPSTTPPTPAPTTPAPPGGASTVPPVAPAPPGDAGDDDGDDQDDADDDDGAD